MRLEKGIYMKNRPIGVFDSGLGGLTAVKELLKILPNEDIVYFGDTGRVPYGNRSRETIIRYATEDINFLLSKNVKMIVAACGTVSSVAFDVGVDLNLPFVGVIEPTAKSAVSATANGKIGVIGTTATIKTGAYRNEINKLDKNIEVFEQDCPLFVPLVENGFIGDDAVTKAVAERYLHSLRAQNIDTLILGCTHYPIISDIISSVIGANVTIINSGKETALLAYNKLKALNLLNTDKKTSSCSFYISDSPEAFDKTAHIFLGTSVYQNVQKIDINDYSVKKIIENLANISIRA